MIVVRTVAQGEAERLLFLSVRVELLEERDQVIGLLLVLQSGIDHLGARDLGLRILDVLAERWLVPRDAGILIGGRICVAGYAASLAADEAVQHRSDAVLRALAD